MKWNKIIIFAIVVNLMSCKKAPIPQGVVLQDSLSSKIDSLLQPNTIDEEEQVFSLRKAYDLSKKIDQDSIRLIYLTKISYSFYKANDTVIFREVNHKALELALNLQDTTTVAGLYWDLGNFYFRTIHKDSSFYYYTKAQKIYNQSGNKFYEGRMLINKAIVQTSIKDYVGSEITTYNALRLLEPLNKYNQIYRGYNNLGIINNELENYSESLEYHKKALEIQEKIEQENFFKQITLNNIGVVEENRGKHEIAKEIFKKALKEKDLQNKNAKLYAMLLDNFAYNSFKSGDTLNVYNKFVKALKIRDSVGDIFGISINKIHLGEYSLAQNDTTKAIFYAEKAKKLSSQSQNYRDQLASLKLLSLADKEQAASYLNQYVKLDDSLHKVERSARNKFTRIAYETDNFIFENKQLQDQKTLLTVLFILLAVTTILVMIILNNRARNKTLVYEQKQQKANEEIYALMLTQQSKLEEGRQQEKHRISGELHDSILSNLFGLRLSLGTLNKKNTLEAMESRGLLIEEIRQVEEEIRSISHTLSEEPRLKDISFIQLISQLLEKKGAIGNIHYDFKDYEDIQWYDIDNSIKMNIYRVIQESLQNITKHAKATKVMLEFKLKTFNVLQVKIKDNGCGYDKKMKKGGIGLDNIKSRVSNLGGEIDIISAPGSGFTIIFKVPLQLNS